MGEIINVKEIIERKTTIEFEGREIDLDLDKLQDN